MNNLILKLRMTFAKSVNFYLKDLVIALKKQVNHLYQDWHHQFELINNLLPLKEIFDYSQGITFYQLYTEVLPSYRILQLFRENQI